MCVRLIVVSFEKSQLLDKHNMAYTFQAKIASRGFHVYKNIWDDPKSGDKVTIEIETEMKSKRIDPYCCAVKTLNGSSAKLITVGHIPREISRHVYFFIKEEAGKVYGSVLSTNYRPSPIPAGGLEIPLTLHFQCNKYITHSKMIGFVTKLYSYEFVANTPVNSEEVEEEENEIHVLIEEETEQENIASPSKEEESDSEVIVKRRKRSKPVIAVTPESEEGENVGENENKAGEESDSEVVVKKRKKSNPLVVYTESESEEEIPIDENDAYFIVIEK